MQKAIDELIAARRRHQADIDYLRADPNHDPEDVRGVIHNLNETIRQLGDALTVLVDEQSKRREAARRAAVGTYVLPPPRRAA